MQPSEAHAPPLIRKMDTDNTDNATTVFKAAETERDMGYVSLVEPRSRSSSAVDATRERTGSVAGAGYVSLLADPSEPKVSLYIVSAKAKPSGAPLRVYGGQCHCGAIRFRVHAPQHLVSWSCNCSICVMKKNTHFVVPQGQFKLLPPVMERDRVHGGDALEYVQAAQAAQRSGDAAASVHPLHWGRPPAEIDIAAWTWHNKAADSLDAPRLVVCAYVACVACVSCVSHIYSMLTFFPLLLPSSFPPPSQCAGGSSRLRFHVRLRLAHRQTHLL